jgi:DNA-binding NtrC family response regulator
LSHKERGWKSDLRHAIDGKDGTCAAENTGMRKARIVIFDDDPLILEILGNYFSSMNLEVQSFPEPFSCGPSQTNSSCSTPCADIIITDFRMPRRNGIELLHNQKKLGCTISVWNKAILSGNMPEEYLPDAYEVAGRFFDKPFSLEELGLWARECISRVDLTLPLSGYIDRY